MREQHFLQSNAWAEVRKAQGQEPVYVGDQLMLIKKLPRPFKAFGIMSQVNITDLNVQETYEIAKRYDLSHVQIDPNDIKGEIGMKSKFKEFKTSKAESLMLRNTVIIDLNKSEEELLSGMKKNTRYNCKLAEKKGVTVEFSYEMEVIDIFIDLFFQTVAAKHFQGRSPQYYKQVWGILAPQKKAVMAIARFEGKPVVARMLFLGVDTVYTAYTGTSRDYSEIKAAYGALWKVILWAKAEGFRYVNLWGVDLKAGPKDGKYGFTQFKIGFGGEVIEYEPAFNLIVDNFWYRAFEVSNRARKKYLGIN